MERIQIALSNTPYIAQQNLKNNHKNKKKSNHIKKLYLTNFLNHLIKQKNQLFYLFQ